MTEICRTCLQEISDNSVIFCLNSNESKSKAISIRCKLEYFVPELDLDVIPNAVICNTCFESLNLAHEFKNKCLETEGRIQRYIEKIGYVFAYIDLKQIAQQSKENVIVDSHIVNENKQNKETSDNCDLTNLHCDTRSFFAVPKIARLLASGEDVSSSNSFKCVHCGYTTSTKPDLENHEKVHLHKCNECDFSAPKRQSLIIHMRQHLKKKFYCNLCNYKTPYVTMLTEHCKVHIPFTSNKQNTDKSFKCKICNYKARLKLDLKSHIKNHHSPYKCIICGFSSSRKENFNSHVKLHTSYRGHKAASNRNPPQTHMQMNFESTPSIANEYISLCCYKCGYKTPYKLDLENHMHLHKSKTTLNLHIKSNGNDYGKRALTFSHPSSTDRILNIETSKASMESCIKN